MKFNVYYGRGFDETDNKELLASITTIDDAENFIKKDIKEKHPQSGYLRITYISETCRWYDYGSYTKFYLVKGEMS